MANVQALHQRIHIIEDTAKICKAMEMVATVKMTRAQDQAVAGRPYVEKISQVIADLAVQERVSGRRYPLSEKRAVRKIAVVHISTDRGLCGGLNDKLNHLVADFILRQTVPVSIIAVGRKGKAFMLRSGQDVHAEFAAIGDRPSLSETLPISRLVIDDYSNADVDLVYLAYPRFLTTTVQWPTMEMLLPVEQPGVQAERGGGYIWEPDAVAVLNQLLPRYVEMRIYHAILELIASEQSARMVAMRNAGDNARDIIQDLTLTMNKTRQETITKEICDITSGSEVLS